MPSHYLEIFPKAFNFSLLPEGLPDKGEAVIVIANVGNIKAEQLCLHEEQRARVISHQLSRDCYLAGRYLLRGILSRWLVMKPEDIPIVLSPAGKPILPQYDCQFSLTHNGKFVAAVFSCSPKGAASTPVGIDLEKERTLDTMRLARRFFSPEETNYLERTQSRADFFKFWCCREAAIKGDGRGLGQLIATTRVQLSDSHSEDCTTVRIEGVSWITYPWLLHGDIHGAVAFLDPPDVIHWCDLREPLS